MFTEIFRLIKTGRYCLAEPQADKEIVLSEDLEIPLSYQKYAPKFLKNNFVKI
jgi:hypothetical protein